MDDKQNSCYHDVLNCIEQEKGTQKTYEIKKYKLQFCLLFYMGEGKNID